MENNLIITYDIDFNSLEGTDYAMMFDYNGINDWMTEYEADAIALEEEEVFN